MFLDDTIAACATYGFTGGPMFKTRVIALANQRERRNADWDIARHFYSAPYQNLDADGMREVRRMFYAARGRLHTFRLTDPNDHTATDEPFGTGDGVTTVFQLSKRSESDGIEYNRRVTLPVAAIVEANGVVVAPTINASTGAVVFSSAPAEGALLTWSGEFDVQVRFDQDELPFSLDSRRGASFAGNGTVNLLESLDD